MVKDDVLNLRVPTEVKAALKRAAEADDRSASSMALKVIKNWLVSNRYLRASTRVALRPRR